jgi:hypothetical protein
VARDDLDDLLRQQEEIGERFKELYSRLREQYDGLRQLEDDKQRIMAELEGIPNDSDKAGLVLEADQAYERQKQLVEKGMQLIRTPRRLEKQRQSCESA